MTTREQAMAPHSNTLAWKIPWMEEPGRLQSMGSLRVGHDWATSLSVFTFMHWRRKWQPTPVFLPGESQGRGSLMGCRLWGRTESDTTEVTQQQQQRAGFGGGGQRCLSIGVERRLGRQTSYLHIYLASSHRQWNPRGTKPLITFMLEIAGGGWKPPVWPSTWNGLNK